MSRNLLIRRAVSITPYVLGLLSIPYRHYLEVGYINVEFFVESYIALIVCYTSWRLIRRNFRKYKEINSHTVSRSRRIGFFLLLAGLSFVFLLFLHFLKLLFAAEIFYVLVVSLLLIGLSEALENTDTFGFGETLRVIGIAGIAFLSFQPLEFPPSYQPILFSFGLSFLIEATRLADRLIETTKAILILKPEIRTNSAQARKIRILGRVYASFLVLGPFLAAFLSFEGSLPPGYVGMLGLIALSSQILTAARAADTTFDLPAKFASDTAGISLLYVVFLFILGLI